MGKILFIAKEVALVICGVALTAASAVGLGTLVKHKLSNRESSASRSLGVDNNASDNIKFDDLGRDEPYAKKRPICVDIMNEGGNFYVRVTKKDRAPIMVSAAYGIHMESIAPNDTYDSRYEALVKPLPGDIFEVKKMGNGEIELVNVIALGNFSGEWHCRFATKKLVKALEKYKGNNEVK